MNSHSSIHTPYHGQFDVLAISEGRQLLKDGAPILSVSCNDSVARARWLSALSEEDCYAACYAIFCHDQNLDVLVFDGEIDAGVAFEWNYDSGCYQIHRSCVMQYSAIWVPRHVVTWYPQRQALHSDGSYHPVRPRLPKGEVYRRYDYRQGVWFSLSVVDVNKHAQLFSNWQNTPRVSERWQQSGTLQEHSDYLKKLLASNGATTPLIAFINDEPFAYFELYWSKEDRIAPYYSVQDFDRGIHMLVGSEKYRGPDNVRLWMTSLCHFAFLSDSRTEIIVSEPSSENEKIIDYLKINKFSCMKEFDFPHKRAAMMLLSRDMFFETPELFN